MTVSNYSDIVSKAPFGFALCKLHLDENQKAVNFTILDSNPAFNKLVGRLDEDIAGKTATEVIPGILTDGFDWMEFFAKIVQDVKEQTIERYLDAIKSNLQIYAYPVDDLNFALHIVTLKKDDEQENLLNLFGGLAPVGIVISDAHHKAIFVNKRFTELVGYTIEDMPSVDSWFSLAYPDKEYREMVKKTWFEKTSIAIATNSPMPPMEYQVRCKDGRTVWIEFRMAASQGFNIIFFTDVSQRKTLERQAAENTEKLIQKESELNRYAGQLHAIMQAMPDMIFIMHRSGDILDIYGADPDKLIAPKDELIGASIKDCFNQTEFERHIALYEHCLKTKTTGRIEFELTINNRIINFESSISAIDDERLLTMVRDVTGEKELKDELSDELGLRQFLFSKNRDGLVIVNNDHRVVDANTEFCRMIGYTGDEVKALYTWDFDAVKTKNDILLGFDISLDVDTTFESKHKRKDGSLYDVEVSARSIHWKGRRLVICTCRDITERKRLEREILVAKQLAETNQRRFEEIAEFTGEFIWEVDKNGMYTYVNSAVEKILGYSPEEMTGNMHFSDLVPQEDKEQLLPLVDQIFRKKEPIVALENVMIGKDGRRVFAITNGIPLLGADGELLGYRGSDRDMTSQVEAEARLEKSEAKYRQMVENINDVIFTLSADGAITYMSPAINNLSGYDPGHYIGRHFSVFIHQDHIEQIKADFEQIKAGNLYPSVYRINAKDGREIWIRSSTKPFMNEKGETEYTGVAQNITRSRKAEKELKESEEKYRMLFNANKDSISIFCLNEDGQPAEFIEMNDAGASIIGYTREELLAMKISDIEEPASPEEVMERIKTLKEKGEASFESRVRKKNGELIDIDVKAVLIDYNNRPAILNITRDITGRKKAEETITRGKQRLESFLDISRSITETMDQQKIMQMIVDKATEVMGLGSGAIYLHDAAKTIRLAAATPALTNNIPDQFRTAQLDDHPHIAKAINSGSYVLMADSTSAELTQAELEIAKVRGLHAILYLPVRLRKKSIGVLILSSVEDTCEFAAEEINMLQGFANQAAQVIDNVSNYEELKKYSEKLEKEIVQRKAAKEALTKSHEKLKKVLEVETVGVMFWDLSAGVMTDANNTLLRMLGFNRSELEAGELNWKKLTPPEYHDISMAEIDKFYETGRIGPYEKEYFKKDGSRLWFLFAGSALEGNTAVEFCVDISDRKKIEMKLKESEERYRRLIDNLNAGIVVHDPDTNIILCNHEASNLLGLSIRQLKSRDALHPGWYFLNENGERLNADEYPAVKVLNSKMPILNETFGIHHPDENITSWVLVNAYPEFDRQEKVTQVVVTFINITEIKDATERTRVSEERWRTTLKTMPDGVVITKTDGTITYASNRFLQQHGYADTNEVIGANAFEFVAPEYRDKGRYLLGVMLRKQPIGIEEYVLLRKDGSAFWAEMKADCLYNENGEIESIILVERDITERKQAEKELKEYEIRTNQLLRQTRTTLFEFDPEGKYTYLSPSVYEMTGYSVDELKDKVYFYDIAPEDQREELKKATFEGIKQKQHFNNFISSVIKKDGSTLWLLTSAAPVINENGELISYRGSSTDITEKYLAEEKLRASEERWRTIIETSPDGIAIIDLEGNIQFVSERLLQMYGYSEVSELLGRSSFEFIHPDYHQKAKHGIEETLQGIDEGAEEFMVMTKSGEYIYCEINAAIIKNKEGHPESVFLIHRDISDRKAADEAVRRSEEKYRIVGNNTYNWEFWENPEGKFLYHSPACIEITGYNPEELTDNFDLFLNMIHPDDRQGYIDHHKNAKLELNKRTHYFRMVLPDGQIRHIEHLCRPVFDNNNNYLGIRGTNVDITQRIEAKEKLIESELFANAVIDSTPALLYIYDVQKQTNIWSNEIHKDFFKEFTGDSAGMNSADVSALTHPDDYPKLMELLGTLLSDSASNKFEIEIRLKKQESWIWMRTIVSTFKKDEHGNPIQIIGALFDINDRKKFEIDLKEAKEKAEESNRLKTAFLNNISHEVGTPLNSILGFGGFMMDDSLSYSEKLDYYAILKKSSERLRQTIFDIIDLAELTAGTIKLTYEDVTLGELLIEMDKRIKEACQKKNIFVALQIPPHLSDLTINTGVEFLKKVMWHLLSNAEKFTEDGRINFGFEKLDEQLRFFVKDTGRGIAADKLEVIFEPFMQEDISMTRGHEGAGLGLAIARGMVELLGGELWVESKKGEGSAFYFTIPLVAGKAKEVTPVKAQKPSESGKPLILVAEDDHSNFMLIKTVLFKAGYSTLHAINGAEAVELCRKYPEIAMVLMDIKMPVMNGLEATALIKEFRPDLPVIAITAHAQTGDKHRMLEAGCDDYLAKPVDVNVLKKLVMKIIG